MTRDPEDAISQQFLQIVYELAADMDRRTINGFQVKNRLNLEHQDYLGIVDCLEGAGYIHAPGSLAKDIFLTGEGAQRTKRIGI